MSTTVLHRDDRGEVRAEGNELIITDLTAGDPVAIRFRSNNETKGKHSIDTYINGRWRELGFIGYKEDERGRTNPAHRGCLEVEFWSHKPVDSWEDADYERVFAVRRDGIVLYKGNVPSSDRLVSANGKFATIQQGDGNLVTYRRNQDGALGPAVWASGYVEP